jgi:hypothetical protein
LQTSGLLGLVRRSEAGAAAQRSDVADAWSAGQATVQGLIVAISMVGVATAAILVSFGQPAQAALGELVAFIFLLRSRSFSDAMHVGCMLTVPVAALLATVIVVPEWLAVPDAFTTSACWVLGALVTLALIALGYRHLPEVAAAHFANVLDRVDTVAIVALLPLVFLAQDVFGWIIDNS